MSATRALTAFCLAVTGGTAWLIISARSPFWPGSDLLTIPLMALIIAAVLLAGQKEGQSK